MRKFIKANAVVEAIQLLPENWPEVCVFADVGSLLDGKPTGTRVNNQLALLIPDREHGVLTALHGDWLIKENGRLDFCAPSVFAEQYQPA